MISIALILLLQNHVTRPVDITGEHQAFILFMDQDLGSFAEPTVGSGDCLPAEGVRDQAVSEKRCSFAPTT